MGPLCAFVSVTCDTLVITAGTQGWACGGEAVYTTCLAFGRMSEPDSLLCSPRGQTHAGLRLQGLPGQLSLVCALDAKRLGCCGA